MIYEGSIWFKRLVKECKGISPYIRIVPIQHGFFRIYWKQAYIHEIYQEMPLNGHEIYENDIRLVSQKYYEEYEDRAQITRKIKNYKEGFWDSLDAIRTRVYMMQNNKEFNQKATERYRTVVVK